VSPVKYDLGFYIPDDGILQLTDRFCKYGNIKQERNTEESLRERLIPGVTGISGDKSLT
jgi:hypothetical protein